MCKVDFDSIKYPGLLTGKSPLIKGDSGGCFPCQGGVQNNSDMKIYYKPRLKTFSRELRKKGTLSEVLLWDILKGKKIKGYQFMRQKPIGDYIVDFFCSKLKLVIEIDGISHDGKSEGDRIRQQKLESLGLSMLRFYEWDVKKDIRGVVQVIESWIEEFERNNKTPKNTTP